MVPCHICGKLVGEPSLRGHIKNIHSTEIHKCDFCDFTTNRAMKVNICVIFYLCTLFFLLKCSCANSEQPKARKLNNNYSYKASNQSFLYVLILLLYKESRWFH